MKKKIYRQGLLIILTLLMAFSCKKETSESGIDQLMVSEFKTLQTREQQKVAYPLLGADEKYYLWHEHISGFVGSNSLTQQQNDHLKKLLDELRPEFFASAPTVNEDFRTFSADWLKTAATLFRRSELLPIINSITLPTIKTVTGVDTKADLAGGCDCNVASDTFTVCGMWETEKCRSSSTTSCRASMEGCGFLWTDSCNGACGPAAS